MFFSGGTSDDTGSAERPSGKAVCVRGILSKILGGTRSEGFTEPTGIELVSDHVFAAMSDTKTPQGVLGIVRRAEYTAETLMGQAAPFLMVLDNLQDPGNLTIFRTAEAAGVTGIVMSRDCVDIYNPKTIRSTMGRLTGC